MNSFCPATETNNDYFTIECSYDAVSWGVVAKISGAGNSNEVKNYEYYDKNTGSGQMYYRLTQTDYDGKTTHSNIISVMCEDNEQIDMYIFPNPAQTMLNVLFLHSYSDNGFIYLFDEVGRNVLTSKVNLADEKTYKITLDISYLSNGNYILKSVFNKNLLPVKKFSIRK